MRDVREVLLMTAYVAMWGEKKNTLHEVGCFSGGEGEIRTREGLPPATLAVWCLRPLGHLSG